ncbi:MAG: leucine-rich repeat domain-containing protein [Candidatus Odinarchaeota archaeon]
MAIILKYTRIDGSQDLFHFYDETEDIVIRNEYIISIDLTSLSGCTTLKRLDLSSCGLISLDLDPLSNCKELGGIYLSNNQLTGIDLTPLSSCTALSAINLRGNHLQKLNLRPLRNCKNLTHLSLGQNQINQFSFLPFKSWKHFISLGLDQNRIQHLDLRPLSSCSKLEGLSIDSNELQTIDLTPLKSCRNLRTLTMSSNKFEEVDLEPLFNCTELETLILLRNKIKSLNVTPLIKCKKLNHFDADAELGVRIQSLLEFGQFTYPPPDHYGYYDEDHDIFEPEEDAFDSPVQIRDINIISYLYSNMNEESWKMNHLLQETLKIMGYDWIGLVDGDSQALLGASLEAPDRGDFLEMIITNICSQIDDGGTSIGLDIERAIFENVELAQRVDLVTAMRMKEMESVRIRNYGDEYDLRPLWLTAYGYQILNSLKLGIICDTKEFSQVRSGFSTIGIELTTTDHSFINRYNHKISYSLQEYIWHIVKYNSKKHPASLDDDDE